MTARNRIIQGVDDAVGERVYAAPVTVGGVTVIAASRVAGGGGGGCDRSDDGDGGDGADGGDGFGGFGAIGRPVGAIVISQGRVRWKPTIDVTRIVLGGQLVGIAYFVSTWLIARSDARAAIKIARAR